MTSASEPITVVEEIEKELEQKFKRLDSIKQSPKLFVDDKAVRQKD